MAPAAAAKRQARPALPFASGRTIRQGCWPCEAKLLGLSRDAYREWTSLGEAAAGGKPRGKGNNSTTRQGSLLQS